MRRAAALIGLVLVATACGEKGTVVETNRVGNQCYVEIHRNKPSNNDQDDTYPIPCEISLDTTP